LKKASPKKSSSTTGKQSRNLLFTVFLLFIFALGGGAIYFIVYEPEHKAEVQVEEEQSLVGIFKKIGQTTRETSKVVLDKTKSVFDQAKKKVEPLLPNKKELTVEEPPSKYAEESLYAGHPIVTHYPNDIVFLENKGFCLMYDETRKNPAWVAYRVSRNDLEIPDGKIPQYQVDQRTQAKVKALDYDHTGYFISQMAPAEIMSMRYGSEAERQSFFMSNAAPQLANLYQGPWRELVEKLKMPYPNNFNDLWVITGPLYDNWVKRLSFGIEVPDSFFVILIDEQAGKPRALSFIFPQAVEQNQSLNLFITNIDEIESKSGFNFMPELQDNIETSLEKQTPRTIW
jgi:endonuclease G